MSHLHVHLADLQKNVGTRLSVYSHASETDKLRDLEEEQEQLNSSLLALTSHFAQVQFRLKQIVDSDGAEKEVSGCTFLPVRSLLPRSCPWHVQVHQIQCAPCLVYMTF